LRSWGTSFGREGYHRAPMTGMTRHPKTDGVRGRLGDPDSVHGMTTRTQTPWMAGTRPTAGTTTRRAGETPHPARRAAPPRARRRGPATAVRRPAQRALGPGGTRGCRGRGRRGAAAGARRRRPTNPGRGVSGPPVPDGGPRARRRGRPAVPAWARRDGTGPVRPVRVGLRSERRGWSRSPPPGMPPGPGRRSGPSGRAGLLLFVVVPGRSPVGDVGPDALPSHPN
jgi:hypothetical protein